MQILTPSASQVLPRCKHALSCGGCKWQTFDYSAQLQAKQAHIERIFSPFLEKGAAMHPIIPSEDPWEYRNKMEFSFSQNKAGQRFLGLMLKEGRRHVFNLEECHLCSSWFSQVLGAVRSWWEKGELKALHDKYSKIEA